MSSDAYASCRVMFKTLAAITALWLALGWLGTSAASMRPSQAESSKARSPASVQRTLLDKYCVTCHNERVKTAGLMLDSLDLEHMGPQADVWEKVVRKLQLGAMPPRGVPRPGKAEYESLLSWLEASLDQQNAEAPRTPSAAIHRLNGAEYANAVRDLLAVDIDAKSLLPADDSAHGFDNIANVLSMSPAVLERYVIAAKKIGRLAVGNLTIASSDETYTLPAALLQDDRMGEEFPFGSRGGMTVRHQFPLDGEYLLRVRLQRNALAVGGDVRGLDDESRIDVRVDGARVRLFTIGGKNDAMGGETRFRQGSLHDKDASLQVRLAVKAGPHVVTVTLQKSTWYVEGVGPSRFPASSTGFLIPTDTSLSFGKVESAIETVDIEGPFNATIADETPSRRRVFVCHPAGAGDEEPCARTILSTLARRAYRRPIARDDSETLLQFYRLGRADGDFETGIQRGIERVLSDPEFLFRIEGAATSGSPVRHVSDLELASRLSFFLWSSIPDDELLDIAIRGRLSAPAELERQILRMLADARAKAWERNFFEQWLYVRNMDVVTPDLSLFPEFDENLRAAFRRETELLLDDQVRRDRGALELLTANYTFVNERLARHYGIAGVYGSHFRKITLPDDRRAGLLGHGSILTVTSYAHRTSPVVRGKWLLETFLGMPPPAPPANVPPFPETDGTNQPQSVRARMEQHRRNPVCATCHAQMDPLGFALENFDAVGKWRTTDGTAAIDATGSLPNGATFDGPVSFRQAILLQYREAFLLTLTEKLLTYALGRGIEASDMPAVRKIVRDAAVQDYRWSALIRGVVRSAPFQRRGIES
jgi:hypothetical protein